MGVQVPVGAGDPRPSRKTEDRHEALGLPEMSRCGGGEVPLWGSWAKGVRRRGGERERSLSKWRGADRSWAVSVSEPGTQQAEFRTHLWNNGHMSSYERKNE